MSASPNKKEVSVVIPAWNEAGRITNVLEVLVECSEVDEVIVVDDGSTDGTSLEVISVLEKFPQKISLITHKTNKGKTDAVVTGVAAAKGETIVLLDADLTGINESYINALIKPIQENTCDMVILDRRGDRVSIIGWSDTTRHFGGERSFRKSIFTNVGLEKGDNYLLEAKLNLYFINHKLRARTVYCKDLNASYKFRKLGFFNGLRAYAKMYYSMYDYFGFRGMYKMMVHIEEDRLSWLYRLNKKVKVLGPVIIICGNILAILTYFDR